MPLPDTKSIGSYLDDKGYLTLFYLSSRRCDVFFFYQYWPQLSKSFMNSVIFADIDKDIVSEFFFFFNISWNRSIFISVFRRFLPLLHSCPFPSCSADLDVEHLDTFVLGLQTKEQLQMFREGAERIVCMDSTFGTTEYGMPLFNVLVPDEFRKGYPVAHFIVSTLDARVMRG